MKLMIASDIHGSAYYCLEMLDAMKKECPDRLLLLGDILYHGPRNDLPLEYEPKKVIKMLNEVKEKLFCVRGNCDTEVDQMVLDFPIMADYAVFRAATGSFTPPMDTIITSGPQSQAARRYSPTRSHPRTGLGTIRKREPLLNPGPFPSQKKTAAHSYRSWKTVSPNGKTYTAKFTTNLCCRKIYNIKKK